MSADRISADTISAVTVLVVDDQRLVREGIASLLHIQEGISVVGQAVNGQEALEKALALRPNVILMDVRMPVMDGIVATAQIHRQLPGCRVIMLTTFDDEEYIVKSLRAGAVGYLLKDIPASQLARAVQLAHAGIYQLEPSVAGKLVGMLGKFPLPVEVIPMARSYVARELVRLGGQPKLREGFTTDNGNVILDVHHLEIMNPVELETAINQITGVVTNGLFARRPADVFLMGTPNGVTVLKPH